MSASKLLFLAVIATLPIQLNKFFFLDYSFVLGIPIDYLAPSIYLTDLTVLAFLAFFLNENRKNLGKIFKTYKPYVVIVVVFNVYLLLSTIFFSKSQLASHIFNLKVLIFGVLPIASAWTLKDKSTKDKALLVLLASILWQSLLLISQFAKQGSLGLSFLGERSFDASTVQIAHSQLLGSQMLRPYGTFPHPNVAASFLAISTIVIASSQKITGAKLAIVATAVFAVVLTASKSAIAILSSAALFGVKKLANITLLSLVISSAAVFLTAQLLNYQIASIAERLVLIQAALDISIQNPLFGIGSNNFIPQLSQLNLFSISQTRLLQPVHNVFLLILTQNGIFGLVLFTALILSATTKLQGKAKLLVFFAILFYLSVDHFLWTLQQGQLIFWLTLAYFLTDEKRGVK